MNYIRTTSDLYEECRKIVNESNDVSIASSRYSRFDPLFSKQPNPVSMDFYLSGDTDDHQQVFGEFIVAAAFNGGYWYDTNPVTQWEVNGSGSMAMEKWIKEELFNKGLHPYHCQDRQKVIKNTYPSISVQPNPTERKAILAELAFNAFKYPQALMQQRYSNKNKYNFNWSDIIALSTALVNSFGGDPYRKKACLVFLMFAGWLKARNIEVTVDLPIPADYQMPRIFEYEGAINITTEFKDKLNTGSLVDVNSPEAMALRAASIIVAHDLAERYNLEDYQIDNVLFSVYRKDENFIKTSTKPMRCMSMWF